MLPAGNVGWSCSFEEWHHFLPTVGFGGGDLVYRVALLLRTLAFPGILATLESMDKFVFTMTWSASVSQSLFYVCSQQGEQQNYRLVSYTNFST